MNIIANFFKKTGHVIKKTPLLTSIALMSVTLSCITIIQVGPENIPSNWPTTPIFGLLLDQDFPNIFPDDEDLLSEGELTDDFYDPDAITDADPSNTDTTDVTDTGDTTHTEDPGNDPDSPGTSDPSSDDNTNDTPDSKENGKKTGDKDKKEDDGLVRDGITVYETYKPRKSKADCYVDTGLIPLTTEYGYFKADDYSYFDDAIFIGDSRTVGLQYYSELPEHADFVCQTGLSINKALSTECAKDRKNGRSVSGEKLLKKYTYGKVYLCIGINDIGTGNTDYIAGIYKNLLDKIRSYQPDAIIYIQSIMPVTKEKSKSDKIINNENINAKNAAIAKFADGEQVFYININEFFTDQSYTAHSGALLPEQSTDGVHIQAVYYRQWAELLLNYGIEKTREAE